MTTVVLSIMIIAIAFAMLSLRVLLVRGGEFRGTCATRNPYLRDEDAGCTLCGKGADETCQRWSAQRWKTIVFGSRQEADER